MSNNKYTGSQVEIAVLTNSTTITSGYNIYGDMHTISSCEVRKTNYMRSG